MPPKQKTYALRHPDGSTPDYARSFLERRQVPVIDARQSPASDQTVVVTVRGQLKPEDLRDLQLRGYSIS